MIATGHKVTKGFARREKLISEDLHDSINYAFDFVGYSEKYLKFDPLWGCSINCV